MRKWKSCGAALALAGLLCIVTPAVSVAREVESDQALPVSICEKYPEEADGTRRQPPANTDVTDEIAAFPPRSTLDVGPGEQTQICIGYQNRTGSPIDFNFDVGDVGDDGTGLPATSVDERLEFGASRWLKLPAHRARNVVHGEIVWLLVDVHVPADTAAGSYYASIVARDTRSKSSGSQVVQRSSVVTQAFFDIQGEADHGGGIKDAHAPRVIWWDGLDLGGLPVLERLRGLGIATARFKWRNRGDFSDSVQGYLSIKSDLSGKEVARIPIDEQIVLRNSDREFAASWAKDIPLLGRFTPTLVMTSADGGTKKQELAPIWVIPSWWYIAAVLLAIAVPLWLRRRSKRRYRHLLARVEAAEGRSSEPAWDDDLDVEDEL